MNANPSLPPASGKTLLGELLVAFDRSLLAGLGAFVGTLSLAGRNDTKSLAAAGIASATAALVSLGNSIRTLSS